MHRRRRRAVTEAKSVENPCSVWVGLSGAVKLVRGCYHAHPRDKPQQLDRGCETKSALESSVCVRRFVRLTSCTCRQQQPTSEWVSNPHQRLVLTPENGGWKRWMDGWTNGSPVCFCLINRSCDLCKRTAGGYIEQYVCWWRPVQSTTTGLDWTGLDGGRSAAFSVEYHRAWHRKHGLVETSVTQWVSEETVSQSSHVRTSQQSTGRPTFIQQSAIHHGFDRPQAARYKLINNCRWQGAHCTTVLCIRVKRKER